jgi:hypothetical protein
LLHTSLRSGGEIVALIKNRIAFAEFAAPEAVAAYLDKAKAVAARADAEVRWLEKLLAEKTAGLPHSHACVTCSPDGREQGPGCHNCRHTGLDQTPCQAEGHAAHCPAGCCEAPG